MQYYPPDAHGVIDEWDALMKQQYDLMTKRELGQALQDRERKKQYHDYLDFQQKEKQRLKMLDAEKKRLDLGELSNNQVVMEGKLKGREDESKGLKSLMAQEWINDMAKNKLKRQMLKEKEIMDDLARIEREKKGMTNDNDKEKEKKQKWLKDQEEMLQFRGYVKDNEKFKQMKEHEAYVKGCADTNKKKEEQDKKWN